MLPSPGFGAQPDIPSGGFDFGWGSHKLERNFTWEEPAEAALAPPHAAIYLSDSATLDGQWHSLLSTSYAKSNGAIVKLSNRDGGIADNIRINRIRFANARYGIMTPHPYDTKWDHGGYVFDGIDGSAYDRVFRVSGHSTLLQNFRFVNIGGSIVDDESMGFGAEFLGPNPTVRNGAISRIRSVDRPGGMSAEGVGLSFSHGCHGAYADNITIGNPELSPNTIGVWIGYSKGFYLRNITVSNMENAILAAQSTGLLENCRSFNCTEGFSRLLDRDDIKFKDCWDFAMIDGVWTQTRVHSE